ncbi:GNAT family N-acetyltransferase [Leisingera sp. HS039]|uniref:GNAT family N-acetyltransferase n=1 Tax=unclassified Leisingera TaxID=2614906 RepID=UPI001070E8F0|nr:MULTISPECIES: GNAT family N-acetyltransferase [unclassified Leisingera]MBQ4824357.1 GNAT family N-acetyltransferase [Leisingera sp. HS039]QBR34886.1 GNAT family N-acetyltransferase [Leisingera sp. NJS201]
MQNKRGISQAFAAPAAPLEIRRANVFDVFAMSRVLIASIRDLCQADHGSDAARIADWTANKTPEQVRGWIAGPGCYWLAEHGGEAAAVGGLSPDGSISLLYVAPAAAGRGTDAVMLAYLEAELLQSGHAEGRLDATRTALDFYRRHGWRTAGKTGGCCGTPCIAMRKSLR